jgi:hypothetical protein
VRRTAVCFDMGGSRFKHLPQPRGAHLTLLPFHGGVYVEINTSLGTGYDVKHCRTIQQGITLRTTFHSCRLDQATDNHVLSCFKLPVT